MISDPHGPDNPNAIWGLTLESYLGTDVLAHVVAGMGAWVLGMRLKRLLPRSLGHSFSPFPG